MNKEIESIIKYYINNDVARDKVINYIEELQNKIHILEDELNWYKQECDDLEMRIGLDE